MTTFEIIGIVLLIAGFILIGIELSMPGFGFPGISGILSIIIGIVLMAETVSDGIVMAIVSIIIVCIMLAVAMTIFSSKKMKAPIVLDEDVKGEHGFLNSSDLEYLIGKEGTASTDLRPAGKGNFDGIDFDILSEGQYIEKGTAIKISKVRDNKLMVICLTK